MPTRGISEAKLILLILSNHPIRAADIRSRTSGVLRVCVPPCLRGEIQPLPTFVMHTRAEKASTLELASVKGILIL